LRSADEPPRQTQRNLEHDPRGRVDRQLTPVNSNAVDGARGSCVVRFVLEFSQALEFRERASAAVFGYDPDIGPARFCQLADMVERRRRAFEVLDELLNCCAGSDPKAHSDENITGVNASQDVRGRE